MTTIKLSLTAEQEKQFCQEYSEGKIILSILLKKYGLSQASQSSRYYSKILSKYNVPFRRKIGNEHLSLEKKSIVKSNSLMSMVDEKGSIISFEISPHLYELLKEFCSKRNPPISVDLFTKKYFYDYLWKMCEGLGII